MYHRPQCCTLRHPLPALLYLTLFAILCVGLLFATASKSAVTETQGCVTGLHLIVARGTNENQATGGTIAQIYQAVLSQIPDSDASHIVYPANSNFGPSCTVGLYDMQQQIANYTTQCPNTKIVLLGFSQGALVIGDLLNANGLCGNSQPLDVRYQANIASIVEVANPAQQANAFLNIGTGASSNGRVKVPRPNEEGYIRYKGRIVSYCQADDYWCASGSDDNFAIIHPMACAAFKDAAVSFIASHQ